MASKQVAEKKDSEVAIYDTDLLSEGTGLEEAKNKSPRPVCSLRFILVKTSPWYFSGYLVPLEPDEKSDILNLPEALLAVTSA